MYSVVRRYASLIAVPLVAAPLAAQGRGAPPPETFNVSANPLLSSFRFRSIGPASMGGRLDDIEVSLSNPNVIYIGYAVGGVFKSEDNGVTFKPVFQTYTTASIGDIAIHPTNPNIVYVGTGEPNNRQTSSFGDGLYKSTDGGKTFTRIGLENTQTIARIVIDKTNPEVVYVAVPGHLFGPSPDRGLYKTTDGGTTWTKIKYIDENTGFTDVAIDPSNSSTLYAASYERRRTSCCFNGGGPGSALWKSTDAGKTWTKLTGNGLPTEPYGRIALDIARSNPKVVYAQIEASGANGESETPAGGRGAYDWCNNGGPGHGFSTGRGGRGGQEADTNRTPPKLDPTRSGVFRSDDRGRSWHAVSNCAPRPSYFSQIRVDPNNENTLYSAGVHPARSTDGGRTFTLLDAAGGFFNMGEDQHALWIDPANSKHLLRGNDAGFAVSWDAGDTWEYVRTMATGLAYWVSADMGHPYDVYTGLQDNDSWGGPSATRGRIGITNKDWFHLTGGDGFQTAVDPTDFHIVYSSSQDGSVFRTDLRTGRSVSIRPTAGQARRADADSVGTCADGRIITASARGGRGARGGAAGGGGTNGGGFNGGGRGRSSEPNVLDATAGEVYRFNWNTPLELSPSDPNTVWIGGNRLFKSVDRGDHWTASADLTKHVDRCDVTVLGVAGSAPQLSKNDGVSAYGTIISVSESPVLPGVVWAGTDDGNLQVSRDGGHTFTNVSANLPGLPAGALTGPSPYWISRIDASHFDPGTAYVAVDGHRTDDLHPYVFVTHDYGATFTSIGAGLPARGNVQVIREDPKNRALLYAGTEFGLYLSLDTGAHWEPFMNGYPTVRTDDILIHPRDGDLIVATHGRSLWIADDITPLQQFTPAMAAQDVALFEVRPAVAYLFDYRTDADVGGDKRFVGEDAPRGTAINYYLKAAAAGEVTVSVVDPTGRMLCTSKGASTPGIHRVQWTLVTPMLSPSRGGTKPDTSCGPSARNSSTTPIAAGTYVAKLTVGGHMYTTPIRVLEDVWMHER